MTLAGLRPGEKLFEEKLMAEIDDYEKILEKLPVQFQSNPYQRKWIDELKSAVGLKCTSLLVEYPYYDSE